MSSEIIELTLPAHDPAAPKPLGLLPVPPEVEEAVAEEEVLPRAIARAAALADKDPATLQTIKQRIYADTLAALRAPLEGF